MDTIALDNRLSPEARAFVGRRNRLLIDGKLVDAASGKTFPVYNPATGALLAQVAEAEAEDVDRAVKAARRAFDDGPWSRMSPSERGKLLWKLADLLERHSDEFAEIESIDNGKPVAVARMADVPLAVDMFRYMAGWATKITGSTIPLSFPGDFLSYTVREPVGVVGQIIPWNFPLLMAAWKLAPALGGRLHGGAESGGADAAQRACGSPSWCWKRASPPAWSTSSPATARPPAPRSRRMISSTRWRSPARPRSAS